MTVLVYFVSGRIERFEDVMEISKDAYGPLSITNSDHRFPGRILEGVAKMEVIP